MLGTFKKGLLECILLPMTLICSGRPDIPGRQMLPDIRCSGGRCSSHNPLPPFDDVRVLFGNSSGEKRRSVSRPLSRARNLYAQEARTDGESDELVDEEARSCERGDDEPSNEDSKTQRRSARERVISRPLKPVRGNLASRSPQVILKNRCCER